MEKISSVFVDHMPEIDSYRGDFISFNNMLKKTTLTGKISCLSIAENLFEYMEQTQSKFSELQDTLLDVLVKESVKNTYISLNSMSQVAIDVLIRNLFERTADVGFLATDELIRNFIKTKNPSSEDIQFMKERLKEYVAKYSVYDEIIIIDDKLNLVSNLNNSNRVDIANSKFAKKVLSSSAEYEEVYGKDSLINFKKNSLIYGCPIKESDESEEVIGALFLSFRFKDEIDGIFGKLIKDSKTSHFVLCNQDDVILATSNTSKLPLESKISLLSLGRNYKGVNIGKKIFLASGSKTTGYEGYFGQDWKIFIFKKIDEALEFETEGGVNISQDELRNSSLIHDDLKKIIVDAENINEDLSDVVINGEIIASKTRSYSLNPILDNIRTISENINSVCLNSIDELLNSIIQSFRESVKFYASLAIDIMDRNLYERANDCRWWALDDRIRAILESKDFTSDNKRAVGEVLKYINNLYTVYTNLFVFDLNGFVIAVSNDEESSLVGKQLNFSTNVSNLYTNADTQRYFVSDFEKTPLYEGAHTYVYYASILSQNEPCKPTGGIGIVFDSTPQFEAMLLDSLPKDDNGDVVKNSFALYVDSKKMVISTTNKEKYKVGDTLEIDDALFDKSGDGASRITSISGKRYIVGIKKSQGYREYKIKDGYKNIVYAVVFVEMGHDAI